MQKYTFYLRRISVVLTFPTPAFVEWMLLYHRSDVSTSCC